MAITIRRMVAIGDDKGTTSQPFCSYYLSRSEVSIGDFILYASAADTVTGPNGVYLYDTFNSNYQYHDINPVVYATNSGNVCVCIGWFKVAGLPQGDHTIRVQWQGMAVGDAKAVGCVVVSGLANSPFDLSSVGTGTGTSPSSGATGTLAQADEVVFGAIGTEEDRLGTEGAWTSGGSYVFGVSSRWGTSGQGAASNITLAITAEVVSATTAQTAQITGNDSRDWAAAIATFKGAAVTARRRALLGVGL